MENNKVFSILLPARFTRYFADAKLLLKFENSSDIADNKHQVSNSSTQVPVPLPTSPNFEPTVPQLQKSYRQKTQSTSPRFPTNEDDSKIIDD